MSEDGQRHLNIRLRYFAVLREQARRDSEELQTSFTTPAQLYAELKTEKGFAIDQDALRVAVNGDFVDFDYSLKDGDEVVFIPPVAGG